MVIKCGRMEFNCTDKDRIMFNGKVYILVTQKYHKNYSDYSPSVAKGTFDRLLKQGKIVPCKDKYISVFGDKYPMWAVKEEEDER